MAAFAERGRSAFYGSATDRRPLELREVFRAFAQRLPTAAGAWRQRLATVNQDAIWSILQKVPDERMSETCKRFTLELLLRNQERLLE